MKRYIKSNINIERCNAYSGNAYLYAAIRVENSPVFATNIESGIEWEVPDDEKGGIIVFSQEVNAGQLFMNKLINWAKQKYPSIKNRVFGSSDIDKIAQKHDLVGWTVGKFLKGRYTGKNGKVYSEDSMSVEIIGVTDDTLIGIAEELCHVFNRETVLVKTYSERNRIFFVQNDAPKMVDGSTKETYPISPDEEDYILNIFNYFDIEIQDAYIQTEIDSYGDKYIDMFVIAVINDIKIIDALEDELESLHDLFEIKYECTENTYVSFSRTYDFYHYFIE